MLARLRFILKEKVEKDHLGEQRIEKEYLKNLLAST